MEPMQVDIGPEENENFDNTRGVVESTSLVSHSDIIMLEISPYRLVVSQTLTLVYGNNPLSTQS